MMEMINLYDCRIRENGDTSVSPRAVGAERPCDVSSGKKQRGAFRDTQDILGGRWGGEEGDNVSS